MKIKHCKNYQELSRLSSESIISSLKKNPKQLICTATGNSPTGLYKELVKAYKNKANIFAELSILKLDEWGGIDLNDTSSCETYIQEKILQPLSIPKNRYISFKYNAVSPTQECERIDVEINQRGSIDLCILGLGKNGHIGFNEPSNSLTYNCHIAELTKDSLQHQMISKMKRKPTYGLTIGMAAILQSKKIIMLVTGDDKKNTIEKFLSKEITTHLPASFLWLHPNVDCYVDLYSI